MPSAVWAQPRRGNFGLDEAATAAKYSLNATIETTLNGILQTAFAFLGVLFLGMILYGGYNWMTAMGEEEKVEKGKSTLIWAAIGLIVILAAYAISYYVIERVATASSAAGR